MGWTYWTVTVNRGTTSNVGRRRLDTSVNRELILRCTFITSYFFVTRFSCLFRTIKYWHVRKSRLQNHGFCWWFQSHSEGSPFQMYRFRTIYILSYSTLSRRIVVQRRDFFLPLHKGTFLLWNFIHFVRCLTYYEGKYWLLLGKLELNTLYKRFKIYEVPDYSTVMERLRLDFIFYFR